MPKRTVANRCVSRPAADDIWVSPEWSADGKSIFASRFLPSKNAYELWRFAGDRPNSGTLLVPGKSGDNAQSSLGARPTPDGRSVVFARAGTLGDGLPAWTIVRRDLASGEEMVLVSAPASPRTDLDPRQLLPPGAFTRWPSAGVRQPLRRTDGLAPARSAKPAQDRWIAYPVQHDAAEASAWLDLLPRYDFTPDGKAIIFSPRSQARTDQSRRRQGDARPIHCGREHRSRAEPALELQAGNWAGPRTIDPAAHAESPTVRRWLSRSLGRIYVMPLQSGAKPVALTPIGTPAFMPSWSADGQTHHLRQLDRAPATATSGPSLHRAAARERSAETPGYYTYPVFSPDGRTILAVRSTTQVRMHSYMEYGAHRRADLVALPLERRTGTLGRQRVHGRAAALRSRS